MVDYRKPGSADAAGRACGQGILAARPTGRAGAAGSGTGLFPIGLGTERDGLVHVPSAGQPGSPRPLLVLLHGAGASASDVMPMVSDEAERRSVLVLAPDSRGTTWDFIGRGYGPDVGFLDRALDGLFRAHAVDPERIAIAGFSDGGSYALSLGLANGRLFSDILAFSPGFAAPGRVEDAPRIFVSHGREDPVLPIERCGRRVAEVLRRSGYDVDYREFIGGHVVPSEMVQAAFRRFLE